MLIVLLQDMSLPESHRWESVYATCRNLETQGVLGREGILYALDECIEVMVKESKERMYKLLKGMVVKMTSRDGSTGDQVLSWGRQQVERWGAVKHSIKLREMVTEAVRAEESMKETLGQMRGHAQVEVQIKRGVESQERFSTEIRVSY